MTATSTETKNAHQEPSVRVFLLDDHEIVR
jgi:hypothetical protein